MNQRILPAGLSKPLNSKGVQMKAEGMPASSQTRKKNSKRREASWKYKSKQKRVRHEYGSVTNRRNKRIEW